MCGAGGPARHAARPHAMDNQRVLVFLDPYAAGLKPARHGVDAVGFLDAQFLDAPHHRRAFGKGRDDGQDRVFIDHRRRTIRRHIDAFHRAEAHAQVGHGFAALFARVLEHDVRAHVHQRQVQAVARQVLADAGHENVGAFDDQCCADRKGGRGRIARHGDGLRAQLWLAGQGDDIALGRLFHMNRRAEAHEHPLGMIARRFAFDHHGLARRVQPGQQHGGFHLGAGHGRGIAHRNRICGPHHRHRQPPAAAPIGARAEQRQRIGHAAHRALAQGCVTREGRGHRRGGHAAHDQPHAGAGIAAVDHIGGFGKATDPHAMHRPCAVAVARHFGPEGAHCLGGVQHILAFQQAGDAGFADRHRTKDQRAVADRLVAGHFGAARQRAGFAGGHRLGGAVA